MPRCQVRLLGAPPGEASHVILRRRSLAKICVRGPLYVLRALWEYGGVLIAAAVGS